MGLHLLKLLAASVLMALAKRNNTLQTKLDSALGTDDYSQAFVYAKDVATIGRLAALSLSLLLKYA